MTPETAIKKQIKDYLDVKKIWYFYIVQGLGAYKGIPDLFVVYEGKTYALEIKTEKGRLSEHQERFKEHYESNGGTYLVVRSIDDLPF